MTSACPPDHFYHLSKAKIHTTNDAQMILRSSIALQKKEQEDAYISMREEDGDREGK